MCTMRCSWSSCVSRHWSFFSFKCHADHEICSAGYIVSAIFICAEYQRLGIHFREYRHLRLSFWTKLAFIFVELGLAIGFGVEDKKKQYNRAAILEWTISLIYIFYVHLSLVPPL